MKYKPKKILILSSGRAGSSTLAASLKHSIKNVKGYFEPFNPQHGFIKDSESFEKHMSEIHKQSSDKIIISKEIIPSILHHSKSVDLLIHRANSYSKCFDRVILLARKDQQKAIESFSYAILTNKWHDKYSLNNLDTISENILNEAEDRIKVSNKVLELISFKWKSPIIYYEDLFSENKNFKLNFLKIYNLDHLVDKNIFFNFIDSKNKYRNE